MNRPSVGELVEAAWIVQRLPVMPPRTTMPQSAWAVWS
jgi:hypothetical protein